MPMKTSYKWIISVGIVLLLAAFIFWGYMQLYFQKESADTDLYTLVPKESKAILEVHDIYTLYNKIQHSQFKQEYESFHLSALVNFLAEHFYRLFEEQAHGLSVEMRRWLVSFHHPDGVYDQVVYGKLSERDYEIIRDLLQHNWSTPYALKKVNYREEEMLIIPLGENFLACYIQPGFYVLSFQKRLIENVIDTYKDKTSVLSDASFEGLRKGRKHHEPLILYLQEDENRATGGGYWSEFDIRMNESAVYLTSGNSGKEGSFPVTDNLQMNRMLPRFEEKYLPESVQMVYQIPYSSLLVMERTDSINRERNAWLDEFVENHTVNEVDLIVFDGTPSENDLVCQMLMLPLLSKESVEMVKQEIGRRKGIVRQPSLWIDGNGYPVWRYEGVDLLHRYFVWFPEEDTYYLTICENRMLVAERPEMLGSYILQQKRDSEDLFATNRLYGDCLNDLAEQANFTLVADMNSLMNERDILPKSDLRILPSFFLKHRDFFKHFMLATQYIDTQGQMSTNLILTYRGDSIMQY